MTYTHRRQDTHQLQDEFGSDAEVKVQSNGHGPDFLIKCKRCRIYHARGRGNPWTHPLIRASTTEAARSEWGTHLATDLHRRSPEIPAKPKEAVTKRRLHHLDPFMVLQRRRFAELAGSAAKTEIIQRSDGALGYWIGCLTCSMKPTGFGGRWSTNYRKAMGLGPAPKGRREVMDAWIDHWMERHEGEPLPPACSTTEFLVEDLGAK